MNQNLKNVINKDPVENVIIEQDPEDCSYTKFSCGFIQFSY